MISAGAILTALNLFFNLITGLIFVKVLMSWIPPLYNSVFGRIVLALTEPILGPIRNLIKKSPLGGSGMPFDFSPIIAFILIEVLRQVLFVVVRSMLI